MLPTFFVLFNTVTLKKVFQCVLGGAHPNISEFEDCAEGR